MKVTPLVHNRRLSLHACVLLVWPLALACTQTSFDGDNAQIDERPKRADAIEDPASVDVEELLGTNDGNVMRPPPPPPKSVISGDTGEPRIDQRRIVLSQQPFDGGRLADNHGRLRCNAKTERNCSALYDVDTVVMLAAPPKISVGGFTYRYKVWICNQENDSFPKGRQLCALSGLLCTVKTTVNMVCGAVFVREVSTVDQVSGGSNDPFGDLATEGKPKVDPGSEGANPFGDMANPPSVGQNQNTGNCPKPSELNCEALTRQFFEQGVRDPGTGRVFRAYLDSQGNACPMGGAAEMACGQSGGLAVAPHEFARWVENNPGLLYCLGTRYDFGLTGSRGFLLGAPSAFGLTQSSGLSLTPCGPPMIPDPNTETIGCFTGEWIPHSLSLLCQY